MNTEYGNGLIYTWRRELANILAEGLASLDPKVGEAARLCWVEEMTREEAGLRMGGISRFCVMRLLKKAEKFLRPGLGGNWSTARDQLLLT